MSIEAMKQALEALETATHQWEKEKAITSLRQAIAEAEKQDHIRDATKMVEQEPHGYLKLSNAKFYYEVEGVPNIDNNPEFLALYTHPQPNVTTSDIKQEHVAKTAKQRHEWVGLTDEERHHARNAVTYSQLAMTHSEWVEAVQKETEKKLKEKNT